MDQALEHANVSFSPIVMLEQNLYQNVETDYSLLVALDILFYRKVARHLTPSKPQYACWKIPGGSTPAKAAL